MAGWRTHVRDDHDNGTVDYDQSILNAGATAVESGGKLTLTAPWYDGITYDRCIVGYTFGAVGAAKMWKAETAVANIVGQTGYRPGLVGLMIGRGGGWSYNYSFRYGYNAGNDELAAFDSPYTHYWPYHWPDVRSYWSSAPYGAPQKAGAVPTNFKLYFNGTGSPFVVDEGDTLAANQVAFYYSSDGGVTWTLFAQHTETHGSQNLMGPCCKASADGPWGPFSGEFDWFEMAYWDETYFPVTVAISNMLPDGESPHDKQGAISFSVTGNAVLKSNFDIYVRGTKIYDGETLWLDPRWAEGAVFEANSGNGFDVILYPSRSVAFRDGEEVTVRVVATDSVGGGTADESWSFTAKPRPFTFEIADFILNSVRKLDSRR